MREVHGRMADKVTRFTDNEVVTTAVFNQRVDETNAALAAVDEAIDGLAGTGGEIPAIKEKDVQQNARLGTLETDIAKAEQDIAANDARDDGQDTQIAELGTTLGQHGTAITALQKDSHTHTNKSVLNGITAEKVEVWDNPTTAEFYTVSLPASKWTGNGPYTQAVSVTGILSDDRPIFGPIYSGTNDEKIEQSIMAGFVSECDTAAGSVTFTALLAKPEVDLTMQLEVIR